MISYVLSHFLAFPFTKQALFWGSFSRNTAQRYRVCLEPWTHPAFKQVPSRSLPGAYVVCQESHRR